LGEAYTQQVPVMENMGDDYNALDSLERASEPVVV
jgi:hypothetical protein